MYGRWYYVEYGGSDIRGNSNGCDYRVDSVLYREEQRAHDPWSCLLGIVYLGQLYCRTFLIGADLLGNSNYPFCYEEKIILHIVGKGLPC